MNDIKTEKINLRVDPALKKLIEKAASKEGRSVSNYVVKTLLAAIKE